MSEHRVELSQITSALGGAPAQPAALATLVQVSGSSYRRPGARLLVFDDGRHCGCISGGCLEQDLLLRAHRVLRDGIPEMAVYDTTAENDLLWGVGQGCEGRVHVFIEPLPSPRPPWVSQLAENQARRRDTTLAVVHGGLQALGTCLATDLPAGLNPDVVFLETLPAPPLLVLFGAGDGAQPLARLARDLGWHVLVTDSRASLATVERFPTAKAVVTQAPQEAHRLLPAGERSFAMIMTHRFEEDLVLLRALLPQPIAYLGLLGAAKRSQRLLSQLKAEGFAMDETMLEKLHAPAGLDLGGSTPETIALSILAELHCRLSDRRPLHLRDKSRAIHS